MDKVTLADIVKLTRSYLYIKDPLFIKLTLACIIGNSLPNKKPIWMMLVAPPSSGKTTVLNTLLGLTIQVGEKKFRPLVNISDLTANSFASGMQRGEKETSLLKKMEHGSVMVFKDFTSILSKNNDEKRIVLGQLREIYDGAYTKRTGNGNDVVWTGHVGAIAGVTESIYMQMENMSVMGDRFMMYQIDQPDRKAMLKFKMAQAKHGITEETQMPLVREMTHKYMQQCFEHIKEGVDLVLPPKIENEIIDMSDFCTKSRSGIVTNDYDGRIIFVPQPEMPARMFEQIMTLVSALSLMNRMEDPTLTGEFLLKDEDFQILRGCAWSSISVQRRIGLTYLATYNRGIDTAALATKTNYPTSVVKGWLEQINALGMAERVVSGSGKNLWRMSPDNARILSKIIGIERVDDVLEEENDAETLDTWERDKLKEQVDNDIF